MAKRGRDGILFDVEEFKRCHDVTGDYCVLGIDEAGRGPVIGPMVYTGAVVCLDEHDDLVDVCGVADSKVLSEDARDTSLKKLHSLSSFQVFTEIVHAELISETMLGRSGRTLNTLSHDTTINIIKAATLASRGKLVAVYVDTVGVPEMYQRMLAGRFPHLRITVTKKADSKYPVVSAASVVAKTTRDSLIKELGIQCGSGYPSDPIAKKWILSNVHKYFVFSEAHSFVRMSWGPVLTIAKQCENVVFEQDLDKENDPRQRKLSFAKPPPKRDALFSQVLGLKNATTFS